MDLRWIVEVINPHRNQHQNLPQSCWGSDFDSTGSGSDSELRQVYVISRNCNSIKVILIWSNCSQGQLSQWISRSIMSMIVKVNEWRETMNLKPVCADECCLVLSTVVQSWTGGQVEFHYSAVAVWSLLGSVLYHPSLPKGFTGSACLWDSPYFLIWK